jgi:copper resistance protein C
MLLRAFMALCAACVTVAAHGHAFLDHAEPKVGSVVATAPVAVKIWFSQQLEPAFSTAQVTDASGKSVVVGAAHVNHDDPLLLEVPLANIGTGEYTVVWRIVSVDTHVTQGRFTFRVGQ